MTTHETLHRINSLIGHSYTHASYFFNEDEKLFMRWEGMEIKEVIDEREIIFTPEFMDKFFKYIFTNTNGGDDTYSEIIVNLVDKNLHDPTSYLANLLGIGTEKN